MNGILFILEDNQSILNLGNSFHVQVVRSGNRVVVNMVAGMYPEP